MTMLAKFIDELKKTTAVQLFRMLSGFGATLFVIWLYTGPFVKSYAAEAFKEMLVAQGVSPEVFKKIADQSTDNGKEIEEIKKEAGAIIRELGAVKQQVGSIAGQIENQTTDVKEVEQMMRQLLLQQLNNAGPPR